jgi:hypothetical protein
MTTLQARPDLKRNPYGLLCKRAIRSPKLPELFTDEPLAYPGTSNEAALARALT